jgi:Zn-dependent peptidase ImmA (M78 family)/transcriptional regulator with XRE-family HTH domain
MDQALIKRVRQVMSDCGMSQRDLARELDIDEPKLSKSMTGKRRFSSLELAVIAQLGNHSVDWLLTGAPERSWKVAARTSSVSIHEVSLVGKATIDEIAERHDALVDMGRAPSTPALPVRSRRTQYIEQANELASSARAMLAGQAVGGTSVATLVELIEETMGVNVAITVLPEGLDGISYQDRSFRMIVLAGSRNYSRQRFTLAHEVGHILWGDANERVLAETMWTRDIPDASHQEARANAFAASFLMPEAEVRDQIADSMAADKFDELSWHFQVSPSSLAWRLFNLGLISADERSRLLNRTARGVAESLRKVTEFLQFSSMSENERRPWRLISAYLEAYAAGESTLRPVASLLGWPLAETEEFFGEGDSPTPHFPHER